MKLKLFLLLSVASVSVQAASVDAVGANPYAAAVQQYLNRSGNTHPDLTARLNSALAKSATDPKAGESANDILNNYLEQRKIYLALSLNKQSQQVRARSGARKVRKYAPVKPAENADVAQARRNELAQRNQDLAQANLELAQIDQSLTELHRLTVTDSRAIVSDVNHKGSVTEVSGSHGSGRPASSANSAQ